jgi:hypothetical protein
MVSTDLTFLVETNPILISLKIYRTQHRGKGTKIQSELITFQSRIRAY